jgi:hypothetical protein
MPSLAKQVVTRRRRDLYFVVGVPNKVGSLRGRATGRTLRYFPRCFSAAASRSRTARRV